MPDPVLNSMSDEDRELKVAATFARFAELSRQADAHAHDGRFLTTECLIGSFANPVHMTISAGRILSVAAGPALMRSWHFSYRATPDAWMEYWQPVPRPGWHDLLALTKRGAAKLEGDLHPFLSNLQFFKDLLALPRGFGQGDKA